MANSPDIWSSYAAASMAHIRCSGVPFDLKYGSSKLCADILQLLKAQRVIR